MQNAIFCNQPNIIGVFIITPYLIFPDLINVSCGKLKILKIEPPTRMKTEVGLALKQLTLDLKSYFSFIRQELELNWSWGGLKTIKAETQILFFLL